MSELILSRPINSIKRALYIFGNTDSVSEVFFQSNYRTLSLIDQNTLISHLNLKGAKSAKFLSFQHGGYTTCKTAFFQGRISRL